MKKKIKTRTHPLPIFDELPPLYPVERGELELATVGGESEKRRNMKKHKIRTHPAPSGGALPPLYENREGGCQLADRGVSP